MSAKTVCLVGNPNCGKTTLFNQLTGARQQVGNWPGVTVERRAGNYRSGGDDVTVVDLPGVYSLSVTAVTSLDERIAREYVLSGEPDLVINIVDASNLERNLYLTAQLLEMRVPMIVALNMLDVARDRGIRIDFAELSLRLGCPVVPLVASRGEGVSALRTEIDRAAAERRLPRIVPSFGEAVEGAIATLAVQLAAVATERRIDARWLAVKLLEQDDAALASVPEALRAEAARVSAQAADLAAEDCDILIADARYGFANAIIADTVQRQGTVTRTLSDRIDRVVLHRLFGIPIFFAVMYLLFLFTINVGSAFIDVFDQGMGALLVDGTGAVLDAIGTPPWLAALITSAGSGVQTVSTFIPVIACLYLFLSFLEDSGYMARAAFVMDRLMRSVGLPGKSFIPLIVGFGCNVPAIMATRTLENRRDRVLTVMMAPFMSCGARLPVYALFAAAFFPNGGQNLVFALYLIGIGFAILTGLVLRNTLLQGAPTPFVMELPPYHMPTLRSMLIRTWDRLKVFMLRAGRVIVAVVLVLQFLNSWGTDGSFGNQDSDHSILAAAGQAATPILAPMGISEENWPAAVGMISGIFAKEAVVGTLNSLYGSLAEDAAGKTDAEAEPFDLGAALLAALATVPENLAALADSITDPLGFSITATTDLESAAEAQEVDVGTFGQMVQRFDGTVGAFAYLLAVLLYMPCVAALSAVWRETGPAWASFAALWTTGLGFGAAVVAYQVGTFSRHPTTAAAWIAGVLGVFALALLVMRLVGQQQPGRPVAPAAAE